MPDFVVKEERSSLKAVCYHNQQGGMSMIRRGEIFFADLSPVIGSEQGGIRPVVVLQNNRGNYFSPTLIIAPVTSRAPRKKLPTQVPIDLHQNNKISTVLLEQIRTLDKSRIKQKIRCLTDAEMQAVEKALRVSVALTS